MARRVDYYFKETLQGLKRNGLVAFAAVSTSFIALFLIGGALLVRSEVSLLIDFSTRDVEVSVFLQDNISFSTKNVLRGLHFQAPPQPEAAYSSNGHGSLETALSVGS